MKTNLITLLSLCCLSIHAASGASWQVIASPNGQRGINELHGVSALAENDVWAVGESTDTERVTSATLVEHWNGTQWSVIPSPNPSSRGEDARSKTRRRGAGSPPLLRASPAGEWRWPILITTATKISSAPTLM